MSAYLAANMIQHVTGNRADKQLRLQDFGRITYASFFNFSIANFAFSSNPFGIQPAIELFWVKRINSDSYQYQRAWAVLRV